MLYWWLLLALQLFAKASSSSTQGRERHSTPKGGVTHAIPKAPLTPWRSYAPRVLQLRRASKVSLAAQRRVLRQGHRALSEESTLVWTEVALLHALQYYGNISIGTPSQHLRLTFDSGSTSVLVQSENCTSKACLTPHQRYFANESTTSEQIAWADNPLEKMTGAPDDRDTTVETFAMGEATGVYARDRLCIASSSCAMVDLVEAQEESDTPFNAVHWDGIFGLSLPAAGQPIEFNALHQLFQQKAIKERIFAVYLGPRLSDRSEITFGGWKSTRTSEAPLWVTLSSSAYWQFAIDDIVVGNVSVKACNNSCQAVVDTGSSLLMGPQTVGDAIKVLLHAHATDCSNKSLAALPTIGFRVNGSLLELQPEDYMDSSSDTCLFAWTTAMEQPEFQGSLPTVVLGMPFLRRYYTIFDFQTSGARLGFARARRDGSSEDPAAPASQFVDVQLFAERPAPK